MKVLLAGVPGWLGSRFLEILRKGYNDEGPSNNWAVRCLVHDAISTSSVNQLPDVQRIEIVRGDVAKTETLENAMQGVDIVFHMIGIIHPRRTRELYQINTLGTENLLTASLAAGVKRFIYVSSNSAAGVNKSSRLMAEGDKLHPCLNYGWSKYQAERKVQDFQETGKIETVILRPCWYYGPYQPPRQTKFFKMIKEGNPVIFGNGHNLRSMSYVDNVCQAMILAAQKERANGQTYWIADARPYSIYEIYATIAELLGVKNFRPRRLPSFSSEAFLIFDTMLQTLGFYMPEIHVAGEMNKNIACSIQKAQEELGYQPRITLREGMRRSIEWCRNNGISI